MKLTFFSKLINGKKPVIEPVIVPKYDESKLDFILKNIGKFRKLKFDKNENNVFENKETSFLIECEYSVELNGGR